MILVQWHRQGSAVVGDVHLSNGSPARVVLVGPRDNPKGAVLVVTGQEGSLRTEPLYQHPDSLPPSQLMEVVCMQERLFGETELPPPSTL